MIFGSFDPEKDYEERPAAYGVIINDAGRIAAVKSRSGYNLPGGGSLEGEPPEKTIEREVGEELARGVEILEKLGEATQYFSHDDRHFKMNAVFYRAAFASGPQGESKYELCWLDEAEAPKNFSHESHRWAAERGLNKKPAE